VRVPRSAGGKGSASPGSFDADVLVTAVELLVGLTERGGRTGVRERLAFRILRILERSGYLAKDAAPWKHRLGSKPVAPSCSIGSGLRVVAYARPVMGAPHAVGMG
jgi:DNA-binding IclR family transcriptional regulator